MKKVMMQITRTYSASKKIAFRTAGEALEKINALRAHSIHVIRPCSPDVTDTRYWVEIFYEVEF